MQIKVTRELVPNITLYQDNCSVDWNISMGKWSERIRKSNRKGKLRQKEGWSLILSPKSLKIRITNGKRWRSKKYPSSKERRQI